MAHAGSRSRLTYAIFVPATARGGGRAAARAAVWRQPQPDRDAGAERQPDRDAVAERLPDRDIGTEHGGVQLGADVRRDYVRGGLRHVLRVECVVRRRRRRLLPVVLWRE